MNRHNNAEALFASPLTSKKAICNICFFGAFFLILSTCLPLMAFPKKGELIINDLFQYITVELGWLYMVAALGAFVVILWFAFGPLSQRRLGDTIEYSTFSWIGMLFCAGVGAGIMFGGSIDWAYYMAFPMHGEPAGSWKAAEWGCAYGMFHWGPICWSIYAILAIPIGYSYYVKNVPILNISQTCKGILGEQVYNWPGKLIDIMFMAGLIAGSATALGLGIPIVAAGIVSVTGIEHSFILEIGILVFITLIFSTTSCLGLKKGLSKLSDFNVYIALGLMLFVFIAGPTLFLTDMAISSLGLMASEFIHMATWMDPVGKNGFTQSWTIFYYAWFVAYAPFMSLFIAKISRGRTVRQVVLGPIIFASLGCGFFYLIFGNFGLHLQLTGQMDAVSMVKEMKGATVIMAIADFLPFSSLYKLVFSTVTAVSMATTFDAVSFALAATTTTMLKPDEEPARWNRLFWAISLSILPIGIMLIDGPLSVLQTASIVVGLPVLGIVWIGIASFFKEYNKYGWVENYPKSTR